MKTADTHDIRVVVAHPDTILTMGLAAALRMQVGMDVLLHELREGASRGRGNHQFRARSANGGWPSGGPR